MYTHVAKAMESRRLFQNAPQIPIEVCPQTFIDSMYFPNPSA